MTSESPDDIRVTMPRYTDYRREIEVFELLWLNIKRLIVIMASF